MKVNNTPPSSFEIPIREYTLDKTHMLLFEHKQQRIKGFLLKKMQFVQFRVIALITDTPTEIRFF